MLLILFIIGLTTYFMARFYTKVTKLPPGPMPLPLLGNIPQLALSCLRGKSIIGTLQMWSKQYGSIFTMWLGPMATVHICDTNQAQEAMVKKGTHFADRPYLYVLDIAREGRGLLSSNGQHWMEQRRFALHTLRNFGLGRNLMQDRIMLEVDYRINLLKKQIDKNGGKLSINPHNLIEVTIGNVIQRLLLTDRFTDEKEKEFFALKKVIDDMTEKASPLDFIMTKFNSQFFPFNRRLAFFQSTINAVLDFVAKQLEERKKEIASGKRDLSNGGEDFVDAFFLELKKNGSNEIFNEGSLAITVLDLWVAGQETTTTTLYWAFAYLLSNPKSLKILQEELDGVTARNRPLELTDKAKTPYLNGVVTETLRLSAILPMNLMRSTMEDTLVGQYVIPKGTNISAEISVIMSDPSTFEDTYSFKPERYNGTNLASLVIPFGIGKRACLGESMARAELYLIIGNLVSTFNISPDLKHLASHEPISEFGAMRRAKPYQMIFERRT